MQVLVKCHRCTALYAPGDWWRYSRPMLSDTSRMYGDPVGKIPDGHCPICNKPPLLEKPVRGSMGM